MQFIARLVFQYGLPTSLMTLILVFATWFPLFVVGSFYLAQRFQFSQEKHEKLFRELSRLPALLLSVHALLFSRQLWTTWHDSTADTSLWTVLNVLESMTVYLALPGALLGLLCGFLLFDSAWEERSFWLGFLSVSGLSILFLGGHLVFPYSTFAITQLGLSEMLAVWSSVFITGFPLMLIGMTAVALLLESGMQARVKSVTAVS